MPRRSRSRSRSPRRDRERPVRESRGEREWDRREDRRDRGERRRDYERDFDRGTDRGTDRGERLERGERPERGDRDERRERGERFPRRSRSPEQRDRFRAAPGSTGPARPLLEEKKKKFTAEDFAGKSEEEIEMMKLMGFGGFETSKGKKIDGNDVGAVHVKLKRTYRQYMNRRGGFNRPLDPVH